MTWRLFGPRRASGGAPMGLIEDAEAPEGSVGSRSVATPTEAEDGGDNSLLPPARTDEVTSPIAAAGVLLDVIRLGRTMTRRLDDRLRSLSLTSGQYLVLASLDLEKAPTLGAMALSLGMDRTTLTANLKPMERSGLVEVTTDKEDRRARRLHLTKRGHKLLALARPTWNSAEAEIITNFGADRAGLIRADLSDLLSISQTRSDP